jgi:hypothetical protein
MKKDLPLLLVILALLIMLLSLSISQPSKNTKQEQEQEHPHPLKYKSERPITQKPNKKNNPDARTINNSINISRQIKKPAATIENTPTPKPSSQEILPLERHYDPYYNDILETVAYTKIQLPSSLGPNGDDFHIIDGLVYLLDNGDIIKQTKLDIEGIENITICIETFNSLGNKTSQMFYNGEEVLIETNQINRPAILSILNEDPIHSQHYKIKNTEIYLSIPTRRKFDLIDYKKEVNSLLQGFATVSLIKKNF